LLILVPPHRGATYIDDRELADEDGWIIVDKDRLQSKAYPNIFAVGDTTDLPISKAGSTAHYQAKVAAKNITKLIKEGKLNAKYDGHAQCFVMMSQNSAMLLDFSYTRPPRRIGYIPNRLYYYVKKYFARVFFRGVLSGRI
jgi:sulfide:quinone oxidoreductase